MFLSGTSGQGLVQFGQTICSLELEVITEHNYFILLFIYFFTTFQRILIIKAEKPDTSLACTISSNSKVPSKAMTASIPKLNPVLCEKSNDK